MRCEEWKGKGRRKGDDESKRKEMRGKETRKRRGNA